MQFNHKSFLKRIKALQFRLPFLSISWRFIVNFLFISLIAIGLVGGFSVAIIKDYVKRQESNSTRLNASSIARKALPLMLQPRVNKLNELVRTAAVITDASIRICDKENRIVADSGPFQRSDSRIWVQLTPKVNERISNGYQPILLQLPVDPLRRANLRRSLALLEEIADFQSIIVRKRSELWGGVYRIP